ncbi:MAG: hypothetical protein WBB45_10180 [Cyclobacteriaceae bacterium]
MNDLNQLQQLWQDHESQLNRQWQLNRELLRGVHMNKMEKKLTGLIRIKAISLVLYALTVIFLMSFTASHLATPHLALAGSILAAWALIVCMASVHELRLLLTVDYTQPVRVLQKHLLGIRTAIIRYLRIGVWALPLNLAFVVVMFQLFFGVDIIRYGSDAWIMVQLLISLFIMVPLAVWLHRKLAPENADKHWMYRLLRGNGAQITDSLTLLEEVASLEDNKRGGA